MEAAVAEREAEMTEWNGDRLDEFREGVDDGFAKVDKRFEKVDEKFQQVDQRFDQLDRKVEAGFARLDKKIDDGFARCSVDTRELSGQFYAMQRTLMQMGGVMIAALIGLIATQI